MADNSKKRKHSDGTALSPKKAKVGPTSEEREAERTTCGASLTPTSGPSPTRHRQLPTSPLLYQSSPLPSFGQPQELGHFSLDGQRKLHLDKRQLRYFYPPERYPRVHFDLKQGLEKFISYDHSVKEALALPLTWIVGQKHIFRPRNDTDSDNFDVAENLKVDFVTFRGHLTKIMGSPYENRDNWFMAVTRYKDVLYMSEVDTEQTILRRTNQTDKEKLMSYGGYKFEQYLTSSDGRKPPNLDQPVNNNEAYCTMVRAKLNQHRLLYSAEVDCCVGQDHPDYRKPPPANYVELKTSRHLETHNQRKNFIKYKLLKWWAQSFLAGVPYVTCGFRDDSGIVHKVTTYRTLEIPRMTHDQPDVWDANVCLNFCASFLQFVKEEVTVNDPELVYLFDFDAQARKITFTKHQNSDLSFIPSWYITNSEGNTPPKLSSRNF